MGVINQNLQRMAGSQQRILQSLLCPWWTGAAAHSLQGAVGADAADLDLYYQLPLPDPGKRIFGFTQSDICSAAEVLCIEPACDTQNH